MTMTFLEYKEKFEMMKLIKKDCPMTMVNELSQMTKVHCSEENIKKLMSILGYVDVTLFERKYGRIANLMKIPVHISVVKALMHFWDPSYICFTFGDVDMTPTIEEYAQILNFPHDPHRVYFKKRIEKTTLEVVNVLCLDQVNQNMTSFRGFKLKIIESKLKINKDNLGKKYIDRWPGLILFPSKVTRIISMEAVSAFVKYQGIISLQLY